MRFPGFIGPSYTLQSVNVDCQRAVNLYPEINALGTGKAREVACLVPTPGKRLLVALPEGPVRGTWLASNGEFFAVGGSKLYRVSSAWVATELGTLNTVSGPVSISDNGLHVILVDGTYGYTWTIASSTFAVITDEDFYAADQVTFQDGYFLLNKAGTQQFFISGLNAVTFDGLDVSSAEGSPDVLIGIISANQNVYQFGSRSIEVFYNSGNADFPFERIQGAVVAAGCAAAFSITKLGESIAWLGGDETGSGIVYQMQGYQAQKISTPAIESVIRGMTADEIADARAYTYQQGGHLFYCLNLPGTNSTWVYDASTGMWHERTYLNVSALERDRADCHAAAFGENVVGDYVNGNLYALDPDTYTDNGVSIVRERAAPHITKELRNVTHSRFQLDMETGVGLSSGQGSAPMAMLQWSDDGGHTWSNERWAAIGAMGDRKTRVVWRRLGMSRDRVYRVRISDPVKVVLIGAEIELQEGSS